MKVYVDMDRVIADFDKGVREYAHMETSGNQGNEKQDEQMWERLSKIPHFYDKLDLLEGAENGIRTLYEQFGSDLEILTGKEKLKRQFTRLSGAYLGDSWQNKAWPVLGVANECFHNYIVGQVVEAIIIGVLCAVGMWALRLPYAPMVGTVVGFTALIPVFGCYLGAAVGALMCLAVSPMKALIFLVFICILQQLEGNLIYPRVVGTSLGLPGIWVLAAVTVGGGMGGIGGMLLSVPLAATIYKLTSMDVRDRETEGRKRTTASDVVDRFNDEKNGEIK